MTETPKSAHPRPHATYIIAGADGDFHQARCDTAGCDWESPEFDGRRYLAEFAADEHQRAMTDRLDTGPAGDTP
jgi:hypothetical protein